MSDKREVVPSEAEQIEKLAIDIQNTCHRKGDSLSWGEAMNTAVSLWGMGYRLLPKVELKALTRKQVDNIEVPCEVCSHVTAIHHPDRQCIECIAKIHREAQLAADQSALDKAWRKG